MTNSDAAFTGSIPETYDEYLVPFMFEDYADDIADRVASASPSAVLELAAGSGVVTRRLAPRLAPDARLVVTDLNQAMLDRAASMQPPDDRIQWQQADALDLPFEDDSFDVVVCQFGVMFFPDKIDGYKEAARVLKPGGLFVFNVWDDIENNEIPNIVAQTAIDAFPDNPPKFITRTPYAYYDLELIRSELTSGGFTNIAFETLHKTSTAPTARHPAIAITQGSPLRTEIEERDPSAVERITDTAEERVTAAFGSGPVAGKLLAHVAIARTAG